VRRPGETEQIQAGGEGRATKNFTTSPTRPIALDGETGLPANRKGHPRVIE